MSAYKKKRYSSQTESNKKKKQMEKVKSTLYLYLQYVMFKYIIHDFIGIICPIQEHFLFDI